MHKSTTLVRLNRPALPLNLINLGLILVYLDFSAAVLLKDHFEAGVFFIVVLIAGWLILIGLVWLLGIAALKLLRKGPQKPTNRRITVTTITLLSGWFVIGVIASLHQPVQLARIFMSVIEFGLLVSLILYVAKPDGR